MPATAKTKSSRTMAPKNSAAVLPIRRRCASECPIYTHPSDAYMPDHVLHAEWARFAGSLSPIGLALAGFDWWAHLQFSPAKKHMLSHSLWDKTTRLSQYAVQAASGATIDPVVAPSPADQRFKSDGWQHWPFNLFEQSFLVSQEWWTEATTGVRGVAPHHQDIAAFTARQLLDMVSPSNSPLTNPDILQTTQEQAGKNFWQGYLNWLEDASRAAADSPPTGAEAFTVGKTVAVTPGKVIYRNDLIELIQYKPTTAQVYAEPVLIVPAWIMKYYILDLSPEDSLVKYLVGKGHTVFMISWKNPDTCDRDLGMEDYLQSGIGEAITAIKAITHAPQIHAMGYCLGGTLLTMMAAVLARDSDDSLKTVTLLAAQTDFEEAGELTLFTDDSQVAYLEDVMWKQGYLDKFQMAGAFQMLRSNDLIWSRMIHDYMQGERQPMTDLMAWNADATRMPYRMHSEYLRQLFMQNDLAEGRFMVKGAPIALKDIHSPLFVVGTVRDHIAPWKSVYKIQLLTDSEVTFVLTSGGHNAGIVSEPGHKDRSYQISTIANTAHYLPPGQWQNVTATTEGSWWNAWQSWLKEHSQGMVTPPSMGNTHAGYAPIENAPGGYVMMK